MKGGKEKKSIRSNAENIPLKESKNIFKTIHRKGTNGSIKSDSGFKIVSQRMGLRKLRSDEESNKFGVGQTVKHLRVNLFKSNKKKDSSKVNIL